MGQRCKLSLLWQPGWRACDHRLRCLRPLHWTLADYCMLIHIAVSLLIQTCSVPALRFAVHGSGVSLDAAQAFIHLQCGSYGILYHLLDFKGESDIASGISEVVLGKGGGSQVEESADYRQMTVGCSVVQWRVARIVFSFDGRPQRDQHQDGV